MHGFTWYVDQSSTHGSRGLCTYWGFETQSLWTIFIVEPGWAFKKPCQGQSKVIRRYYADLSWQLHKICINHIDASHQLCCLFVS